ncbi:MAG: 1-phosphofructokinase [Butyricicoccus sp.]
MIYTVTLNPSLDYIVDVDTFQLGRTNRTAAEQIQPGGKGINVSRMLKGLGIDSVAFGFAAGFTGEEICRRLSELGLHTDFIRVEQGMSRINFKLRTIEGTEVNGRGPTLETRHLDALAARLEGLRPGDVLCLSGSTPAGVPGTIYRDLAAKAAAAGAKTVVDAAGELLTDALAARPFLVKPNQHELGALFGVEIRTRGETVSYAKQLQARGARNVLVSLGGAGAVLAAESGEVLELAAPRGTVVNTVGAGDSMVAGFLAGWQERPDAAHALRMAVAAGSASAFSEGFAGRESVEKLYQELGNPALILG